MNKDQRTTDKEQLTTDNEQSTTDNGQRTQIRVLFVCLGNICRSPMAEAVFKDLVAKAGLSQQFRITSGGTGDYYEGEQAHPGTRHILSQHGIRCDSIAQQVRRSHLEGVDYIVAMDRYNLSELRAMAPRMASAGHLYLLLNFADPHDRGSVLDVPDPYYTRNFAETFRLVEAGCKGLLAHIRRERGI